MRQRRTVTLHRVKYPKGDRWILRWYGFQDGKSKRFSRTLDPKTTKTQANRERSRLEAEMDAGIVKRDRKTGWKLAEFADHHKDLIADKARGTRLIAADSFGFLMKVVPGETPMDQIGSADVARMKAKMSEGGKTAATIDKTVRTLRAAFNRAEVGSNPFVGQGVRWEPKSARIFTRDEISALITSSAGEWWAVFLTLLSDTGLRKDEALNLRWEDTDLDAGTITIQARKSGTVEIDGREYVTLAWQAKCRSSYRTIPMTDRLREALTRWRIKSPSPYVLVDLQRLEQIGTKVRHGLWKGSEDLVLNVLRDFKALQRRTFPKAKVGSLHDLRKSYATNAASGGLPMHLLQRVMGHADIQTTAGFYTKPTATDADLIRRAIAGPGPNQDQIAIAEAG